jgi:hypothetical protein
VSLKASRCDATWTFRYHSIGILADGTNEKQLLIEEIASRRLRRGRRSYGGGRLFSPRNQRSRTAACTGIVARLGTDCAGAVEHHHLQGRTK